VRLVVPIPKGATEAEADATLTKLTRRRPNLHSLVTCRTERLAFPDDPGGISGNDIQRADVLHYDGPCADHGTRPDSDAGPDECFGSHPLRRLSIVTGA